MKLALKVPVQYSKIWQCKSTAMYYLTNTFHFCMSVRLYIKDDNNENELSILYKLTWLDVAPRDDQVDEQLRNHSINQKY